MKKSILLRSCAVLAVPFATAVVAPTVAAAQQITTEITGQVTNEAGAPLPNAVVVVTDNRTGSSRQISAGQQGLFIAQNLSTGGPYTVTATAQGYQGQTVEGITTSLQGATQLTFALTPVSNTDSGDTIVVTAQRARVTQLEVGPGTAFSAEVMESAPSFNRDVRDVIRIDPRVSLDREDASTGGSGADRISCLGGNDRGNTFTVDGIPQSDIYGLNDTGFSSRSSTPLPYDAIRETQVQFAPFDVEYGQFTGCAINVVTKGGTNRFSGTGFYEYADDRLRGNEVDGVTVGPIDADKRWGVALGGPILPDRLFFFGAYESHKGGFAQEIGPAGAGFPNEIQGVPIAEFNRISEILQRVYGIDTGGLITSRPFRNKRFFGRLDWQITDGQRLEATYQRLKESTVQSDDNATSTFRQNAVGVNTFNLSGTDSHYYSARLLSNWTDRFSTELRYSRSDVQDLQGPVGGGEAQSDNPIPRIIVGVNNPTGPDGSVQAGPGFSRSANDLKTKIDLYRAVANYDAGSHRLKFGAEVNQADIFNLFVQNATGALSFRNAEDLEAGLLSPGTGDFETFPTPGNLISGAIEGAYGNFSRTGDVNDAAAAFQRTIWTAYAQDDWRVNDRLNLVLGLRADFVSGDRPDENPRFVERYGFSNAVGFSDIDPVILPRLGFTYDLADFSMFSSGRLQGGVGVFSGGDPLVWFSNAFQNNGFGFAEGTTQASGCPAGQIDVVVNGQFTGVPECIAAAGISRAAAGLGDTQSTDPGIKTPSVLRANLGYQTRLEFGESPFLSGWRVNLDYIYSRYRNPFTIVDLSQTPDFRRGLNGFTIDGRPIYRAIDPTVSGCDAELVEINPTPVWQNVTSACFNTSRDDELMLTNADGYRTHVASAILSKGFNRGILTPGGSSFFTLGYAYTNAEDRRNLFNSTATSNYDQTAALDRQNPEPSRGFYESRHNLTFSSNFREKFFADLTSSMGFTFVARSGRPYSLTFANSGVFNDSSSGSNNALLYIPTGIDDPNISPNSDMEAVQQLVDFAQSLDCAEEYIGRTIERNTCTNDWYYDLDLRFSQELPGPARLFGFGGGGVRDRITLYAMFDNFLNLLDSSWNVQRRRHFAGLQEVATLFRGSNGRNANAGIDAQGRYVINGFLGEDAFEDDNFINVSSSVWRIKVGLSYKF